MSRSSSPQTTTTTSEPPAYIRPFLQEGTRAAADLFRQGGTPIAPFSHQTQDALRMAQQRALSGSPVTQAGQDLATRTLSGEFLGSNPFLEQMFGQAAGATQNRLASEFGRSGRDTSESRSLRADELNRLATGLLGGNFEAERQRQQQILPFVPSLASQDFADIGQLANVGQTFDIRNQSLLDQPAQNIDAYLARLAGFPGGVMTQSTPTERNPLAGALGGAQMGSMFGPWGMLGGAVLGGFYG